MAARATQSQAVERRAARLSPARPARLEHRAFWPYLFADPAQQPIAVLAPYLRLAQTAGPLLPHGRLHAGNNRALCDYDYVLLLGAGGEPDVQHFGANRLDLLRANSVAALYRVRPASNPGPCPAAHGNGTVSASASMGPPLTP